MKLKGFIQPTLLDHIVVPVLTILPYAVAGALAYYAGTTVIDDRIKKNSPQVVSRDINGDGIKDTVIYNPSNRETSYFMSTTNGNFINGKLTNSPPPADLYRDGKSSSKDERRFFHNWFN